MPYWLRTLGRQMYMLRSTIRISALLALGGILPLLSASEPKYSHNYQQCLDSSGGVTTNIRLCNSKELKYQDKLLNKNYKGAMKRLDKDKQDELKKVQRLWVKYRDARCNFQFGITGGTIDLLNGDSCLVDMTAQRAKELEGINNLS